VDNLSPVGVFDSGIGGLSVLRALRALLPDETFLYIADQARVPYGPRPIEDVRQFSEEITRELLLRGAKVVVVACNTASAAALHHLRDVFPEVQFIGMEPAVKPAAETTRTGVVGVLATPATFQGELFSSVVERFAQDVSVLQHAPLGLVEQIEAGRFDGPETREILRNALLPMLAQNIDTVVLGCTHYPFVIPQIQAIVGEKVRVIHPSPAIAAQTRRVLTQAGGLNPAGPGKLQFFTTGDPERMKDQVRTLLGEEVEMVEQRRDLDPKEVRFFSAVPIRNWPTKSRIIWAFPWKKPTFPDSAMTICLCNWGPACAAGWCSSSSSHPTANSIAYASPGLSRAGASRKRR